MQNREALAGRRFGRWTVLDNFTKTEKRERKWLCRCDCGSEVDVSYNDLVYGNQQSCGCQKREHDRQLGGYLTRVDGTSLDMIRSSTLRSDNSSGYRGVSRVRGKYQAKIVFQKKVWHLGTYARLEEAAEARREAEELLFEGTAAYYARWKARAESDPAWAEEHPVDIRVCREPDGSLRITFSPEL
ncbi:MAG: hypothetical protein IJE26_05310 [Oscillospiraceae bacterium]|nr:hypothetical protein [Oscillospiraceae bacterium]